MTKIRAGNTYHAYIAGFQQQSQKTARVERQIQRVKFCCEMEKKRRGDQFYLSLSLLYWGIQAITLPKKQKLGQKGSTILTIL